MAPFGDRCSAFPRWPPHLDAGHRPEAGAPSTTSGVRHKGRRDPGPLREDPARVARGPVAVLQRTSASALLTLISSKKMHARVHLRPRRFDAAVADHNNHDLPKPIRRRCSQFFLWVAPRASAVQSSATAGRERAPVTRATPSSSSRRQKWQHEAEVVRGRQGSHIIRRHLGAAWSSEGGERWSLDGRSRAAERVDWCAPCSFCTKLRHERATMAHPRWHEAWGWSGWWTMGEQSDGFDGMEGSLWRNVMSVECGNECLRVEHNLFCTTCPGFIVLSRVSRVADINIILKCDSTQCLDGHAFTGVRSFHA